MLRLMLTWMLAAKLLHVLSAMLLVAGMLGRNLTYAAARRQSDLPAVTCLLQVSERFERLMVRPGSELVFLLGLVTAWLQRLPVLSVLVGARPAWVFVSLALYLLTIPLVIAILAPASKRRRLAVAKAIDAQHITTELRAALDDRAVPVARNVELTLILLVIVLMVWKPF
jgi:hypothetical protein